MVPITKREKKKPVPKLENGHRICPLHWKDLALSLAYSFHTRACAASSRPWGRGGGQRLTALRELGQQTALPLGNA